MEKKRKRRVKLLIISGAKGLTLVVALLMSLENTIYAKTELTLAEEAVTNQVDAFYQAYDGSDDPDTYDTETASDIETSGLISDLGVVLQTYYQELN